MLYRNLRAELTRQGLQIGDLGRAIDKCHSSVSLRMCGHTPFTMEEAYTIMDFLGLPYLDLPKYFPPKGIDGMQLQPGMLSA